MSAKSVICTLQQISAKAVDEAAGQLATSNKELAAEESKLSMLEVYRNEYSSKLSANLASGVDIQMHQNYLRFMHMLDDAIHGQQLVVANAKQQVQFDQSAWQESNKKKLSYEVLGDRAQQRMQLVEDRLEQKMMDEFAMRSSKVRLA